MNYSPELALATAAFEIVVATWALRIRLRGGVTGDRTILGTTSAILFLLAGYQLFEVGICANPAAVGFLPRLAFIDITWLPPLGLLLVARIYRPTSRLLYGNAYVLLGAALGIVAWIVLDRGFISASVCSAVFAHYTHAMPRFRVYAGFYWAGLLGMTVLSGYGVKMCPDPHRRRLLNQVFVGTVGFVAPSIALSYFVPPAQGALPSVLCHFALVLAVCLARLVYLERPQTEESETPAVVHEG